MSPADSLRHLHVVGPTGTGKSSLLLRLILGDLAAGHGVVLLDPKGDLFDAVVDRVPERRMRDVILLDPTDRAMPVGFNLFAGAERAPEVAADQVVALFRGLYPAHWGPRSDDVMRSVALTLTRHRGLTLAEVPLILTDASFRRRLTATLDDPTLEGFWSWYESLSEGERGQVIGPPLNKTRTFLLRPRLRNVIGQSQSTFSLAEVLDERKVLLVNLAKGVLGEDAARLLGSAIVAQLWQAVQARAAVPEHQRQPVYAFVDEFQDYAAIPTSFSDLLAQARGYRFGLTLANQFVGQLPTDLRQAVLANARSRVIFQVAHADAALLAKEFGPDVDADDLGALGAFEAVAQVAAKSQVSRPVSIATLPPPPSLGTAKVVRALSRQRYGRPVEDVERELRARTERVPDAPIKRTRRAS
ncbi:MAG: type IV secretory system conjugative DNA transfer family protein [Actinomycetota bacterium]|nr:type IV secretory system conjugative DNA transfer family protein [Actinomycetota bacterium]